MSAPLSAQDRAARRKKRRREARIRAQGVLQGALAMLRPGDVVFDCGANVGEVSAALAATGATVHAFEPDPVAFAKLDMRLGGLENVHLHPVCVGTQDGVVPLMRADNFAGDPAARTTRSSIVPGGTGMQADGALDVEMIDLIALLKQTVDAQGEIAFVKLDVEGAELDLLDAMDQADLFAQIRLTVAETHQGKFPDLRTQFKDLRARLTSRYPPTTLFLDWI